MGCRNDGLSCILFPVLLCLVGHHFKERFPVCSPEETRYRENLHPVEIFSPVSSRGGHLFSAIPWGPSLRLQPVETFIPWNPPLRCLPVGISPWGTAPARGAPLARTALSPKGASVRDSPERFRDPVSRLRVQRYGNFSIPASLSPIFLPPYPNFSLFLETRQPLRARTFNILYPHASRQARTG